MPSIEVTVLKGETKIHGRTYEMYSGYLTPNQLIKFCDVPSFDPAMLHSDIAQGLKNPPIKNWQRPLGIKRLRDIRKKIDDTGAGTPDKDSLMANPVLIGKSNMLNHNGVSINVEEMKVQVPNARPVLVPYVYKIILESTLAHKPLWILDGQHRIHGLGNSPYVVDDDGTPISPNGSIVENETIPVVFVIDSIYQPKFLAKIFTEVTTEAKPMDPLHGDWMQYAFDMGDYRHEDAKSAMSTVIELITKQTIDGAANEFNVSGGQIKFNPELNIEGVGPIKKSSSELRKIISERYFKNLVPRLSDIGKTSEQLRKSRRKELATSIVRFYRASAAVDTKSTSGSRLIDPDSSLDKLATEYFGSFLEHLAMNPNLNSNDTPQWEAFLKTPDRQFDLCDWSLPTVSPGSTQTNRAYKPSETAAKVTFMKLFNSPADFHGVDPAKWLLGPGLIEVQSAPLAARFPRSLFLPEKRKISGGHDQINLRANAHKMIRFRKLLNSQATIVDVQMRVGGHWESQGTKTAITLPPGQSSTDIKVTALCYSDDSVQTTEFQVLS